MSRDNYRGKHHVTSRAGNELWVFRQAFHLRPYVGRHVAHVCVCQDLHISLEIRAFGEEGDGRRMSGGKKEGKGG